MDFLDRLLGPARAGRLLRRTRIAPARQILLFQQMEMLLSSGVLLADAIGCLRDRFPDGRTRRVLREVHGQVAEARASLSKAMAAFPRSFPPGVVAVIEAGEGGGSALLAERFADLASRAEFEETRRRQIRRACAYPAFAACMAAGLLVFLLQVVFPRLKDLLVSLGGQLPPLTRAVMGAAEALRRGWLPIAAFAGAAIVLGLALRRVPAVGRGLDRFALHVPVAGAIYRDSTIALICRIYRSLYLANQPAPLIFDSCIKLVDNREFRRGLGAARSRIVRDGATLAEALAGSGLFPPLACLAIEVGERSGRVASALEGVSLHFGTRARERLETAIAVINPAMTVAVVAGAGVIIISFFQAAYQVVYVAH